MTFYVGTFFMVPIWAREKIFMFEAWSIQIWTSLLVKLDAFVKRLVESFHVAHIYFNKVNALIFHHAQSTEPIEHNHKLKDENKGKLTDQLVRPLIACNARDLVETDRFSGIHNAANSFRFADYHSMFFPSKHDPFSIDFETFRNWFVAAKIWFERVHAWSSSHDHPMLLWDSMPHAGASQVGVAFLDWYPLTRCHWSYSQLYFESQ